MPATRATAPAAERTRRLLVLPREPPRPDRPPTGPLRYRLARLEGCEAARVERFAHLKRAYD